MVMIGYYIIIKPYNDKWMNNLELFNELCIYIINIHLLLATDFIGDNILRYNSGWSIILATVLNILVNMLFILVKTLQSLY